MAAIFSLTPAVGSFWKRLTPSLSISCEDCWTNPHATLCKHKRLQRKLLILCCKVDYELVRSNMLIGNSIPFRPSLSCLHRLSSQDKFDCASIHSYFCLSDHPPICLSFHPSLALLTVPSAPSLCPSVCLSVQLSVLPWLC